MKESEQETIHLYVVEYEDEKGERWHTCVEALTIEAAKEQFERDNPDAQLLSII